MVIQNCENPRTMESTQERKTDLRIPGVFAPRLRVYKTNGEQRCVQHKLQVSGYVCMNSASLCNSSLESSHSCWTRHGSGEREFAVGGAEGILSDFSETN